MVSLTHSVTYFDAAYPFIPSLLMLSSISSGTLPFDVSQNPADATEEVNKYLTWYLHAPHMSIKLRE